MKLIIVTNRAPVTITHEKDGIHVKPSSGGLATGLTAYVKRLRKEKPDTEIIWIGWPGCAVDNEAEVEKEMMKKYHTFPVFMTKNKMRKYYDGFCNSTIWPLFHYFPMITVYEREYWEEYVAMNQTFCNKVISQYKEGDTIWVHDYQLMLLPGMLRTKIPDAMIGFFLHIPFPSYEVFRLLPNGWRKDLLEGLFGADLIGFHTFDYRTYFLRSALAILGLADHMGEVVFKDRLVKTDVFPMGIDYHKFFEAAKDAKPDIIKDILNRKGIDKIVLSIDRQDYTKGIINRLKAYEYFLETHPTWIKHIVLLLVVVPSRSHVESYKQIRSQIDELTGFINGKYGNIDWQPIHYQYKSVSFKELIELYKFSDVALVTPLRDGMNLIAKEYVASKTHQQGVLILSEMTGVAKELDGPIIINPNNKEEMCEAIALAVQMDVAEQQLRLKKMQARLMNYDVFAWVTDFMTNLKAIKEKQERLSARLIGNTVLDKMAASLHNATHKTFFLDYDGTLVEHTQTPEAAIPDAGILLLLKKLSAKGSEVIIVSGRDKQTLNGWFGHLPIGLIAEHGVYIKEINKPWKLLRPVRKNWKKRMIPILTGFVEKLPNSFIEEKEYSVAFHYRMAEPNLASLRVKELQNILMNFTSNMDVQIVAGNKVVEIRNSGIDKGVAALHWLGKQKKNHFILAMGDDTTDEDLFRSMPKGSYTLKVGVKSSFAAYNVRNTAEARKILEKLAD